MMDNNIKDLCGYMGTLLEAGFDVQSVLEKGLEAAFAHTNSMYLSYVGVSLMDARLKAAEMVHDAAKALKIDLSARYTHS